MPRPTAIPSVLARMRPGEADVIRAAVLDLLAGLELAIPAAKERRRQYIAQQRTTCLGCGCLVLLDECCPGCQARRLQREEVA